MIHKTIFKKLFALFIIVLFLELSFTSATALQILNPTIANITANSAKIQWNTDEPANSTVQYGIGQLTNSSYDTAFNTTHEITIQGLQQRSIYTARIVSENLNGSTIRPGLDFVTERGADIINTTIDTDIPTSTDPFNIPRAINQSRMTINGHTEARATIRFFVNSDSVPAQIIETGSFDTTSNGDGNFTASIQLYETVFNGIRGYNQIKIRITDSAGNVHEETRIVIVDTIPPFIEIADIPQFTNQNHITIKGSLGEEAELFYSLNNEPAQQIEITPDLKFDQSVSLGGDGNYSLSVIAVDDAHNGVETNYDIHVDSTPCTLTFPQETEDEVFSQEQRFSIVTIKADTSEAKCKVTVINFKEINPGDLSQEQIDELIDEFKFDLSLGVAGTIIGGVRDYESDDSGDIKLTVALGQSIQNETLSRTPGRYTLRYQSEKLGINNIRFVVEDRAGNTNFVDRTISFEPGSTSWNFGRVQTIPNTVYSNNLFADRSTGVDVALLYDLYYLGPSADIKNLKAIARPDATKYDNKHMRVKETFSRWYPEENRLFVYTKVNINSAGTKNADELLKSIKDEDIKGTGTGVQMDLGLVTTVSYDLVAADNEKTRFSEDVYFKHAVGLETPFDYNRFLTPEMIKNAISLLDDAVKALEKMVEIADIATLGLTAGCVAMTAVNYFSGATPEELDLALKRTYYVCDRVWCPTIPRDCAEVTRVATTPIGLKYIQKGDQYFTETDKTFSNPVTQPPQGSTYSFEQNNADVKTSYTYVDGAQARDASGQRVCPQGMNAVEIREQNTSQSSVIFGDYRGYRSGSTRGYSQYTGTSLGVGTLRYECMKITKDEFITSARPADIGCYTAPGGPPAFHETKCVPDSVDNVNNNGDINPYEDIFISTRCGCVSGIRGHLANILRITQGFQKCLHQALIGEVRGAYCERLFAQFVCDLISSIVKAVTKAGKDAAGFDSGEGFSVRNNFQYVNDRLKARYGAIIQNRFGLSSDQVVHKACVAAITGDWTDLNTLFQQSGRVAVAPVIGPMLPESRFNAYNPFTGEASINYYTTIGILSGGQQVSGNFRVICDPNKPGGEYCPKDRAIIIYEEAIFIDPDGSIEKNIFFTDEHALFWGNVAVLDLRYDLGDQPQVHTIKEEQINHKDAILAQCHFNVIPPGFSCETINGGNSAIEFKDATLTPNTDKYYPGDNVWVKASLGVFGGLARGATPIGLDSGRDITLDISEQPKVYLIYDLLKPNGQIETNRHDQQALTRFLVPFDSSRETIVFNPITFGGGSNPNVAPSYMFRADNSEISGIIPQVTSIPIDPTKDVTITSTGPINQLTAQATLRNIRSLSLKDSSGNGISCVVQVAPNNHIAKCTNSNEQQFVATRISYEILAETQNDVLKLRFNTEPSIESLPLTTPAVVTQGSSLQYPYGTYKINLTLYNDVFDPTSIDERDQPVAYGETDVQTKLLSFVFGDRLQSCKEDSSTQSSPPKLEIIYPRPDEFITKELATASTSFIGGGVYISLLDDCDTIEKFKSIRLFDAKALIAAEQEIRNGQGLTVEKVNDIYKRYAISSYDSGNTPRQNPNAGNLISLSGNLNSQYLNNDAFELIVKVEDSDNNKVESKVRVISSASIGDGLTPVNQEELSCRRFAGVCSDRCDITTQDDLGPCDSRRCCRSRDG